MSTVRRDSLPEPHHFRTAAAFRRWLATHHATAKELIVGIYKKDSGRGGLTYPEALDEALCYGWIDGVRRAVDEQRFSVRFTPRKPKSYWSKVNIAKAEALIAAGEMRAPGLAAFHRRDPAIQAAYSFENTPARLPMPFLRAFRRNAGAWTWFSACPPGYRKLATWWVVSAKRSATRERRLATLIACSAAGRSVPPFLGALRAAKRARA